VTLSLPTDLLRQVKILAVKQGTSLSGLLASQLKELVQQDESYRRARRRHRARMKDLPDLGTRGRATWTREDLHER
jgi:hypothetical protein